MNNISGDDMNSRQLLAISKKMNGDYSKIHKYINSKKPLLYDYDFEFFLNENNIKYVSILDDDYPLLLRNIYNPPYILYFKGDLSLINKYCVGVIGSRKNSPYGKDACKKVIRSLSDCSVVVSGLAYGIDSFAHRYTLDNNGKTIAVIGSGFFNIYPKQNEGLAKIIMKDHLIISEYPPHVKPMKHHFPMRNRIIAGIINDLVVVESKKSSGTHITVDLAIENNVDVYCVVGSILNSDNDGNHHLINEGAYIFMDGLINK